MEVGYGALCFKTCKHTSAVDGVCCEWFLSMMHNLWRCSGVNMTKQGDTSGAQQYSMIAMVLCSPS